MTNTLYDNPIRISMLRIPTVIIKNIINNLYNKVNIFLYDAFSNKMNNDDTKKYLKESRNFLELFSKIENNHPSNKKTKKEIKK